VPASTQAGAAIASSLGPTTRVQCLSRHPQPCRSSTPRQARKELLSPSSPRQQQMDLVASPVKVYAWHGTRRARASPRAHGACLPPAREACERAEGQTLRCACVRAAVRPGAGAGRRPAHKAPRRLAGGPDGV
jgi:hypothetical protein